MFSDVQATVQLYFYFYAVLGAIVFSKYFSIFKIQNTILFCIFKILLKSIYILYFQNTFKKYFG